MRRPDEQVIHSVECDGELYALVLSGVKPWEYRYNDRGYLAGDLIELREVCFGEETGRCSLYAITYALHGPAYGIPEGYCVLTLGSP